MFYNRLKWFTIGISVLALVIVGRLVDVQIVRADQYETLADRMLTRPIRYLSAPRGRILDRDGRVLVSDEPTFDVSVHYALLPLLSPTAEAREAAHKNTDVRTYVRAVARQLRRRGEFSEDESTDAIEQELFAEIDALWWELAELTGEQIDDLYAEAHQIMARVVAIRAAVVARSPTIRAIAEEYQLHPLIEHIDESTALTVRMEFERRPWLRVVPSSQRAAHDADPLVHLLGRLGSANADRIEADALGDDELRGLRGGERVGVSGVERLGEYTLRGARGRIIENFDREIEEHVEPLQGDDVRLTIDMDLQRASLGFLKEAVDASEHPCGGAAVVIDVATREVLALASYPIYRYDEYRSDYARLRDDTRWMPLRSRTVQNIYPPGSTCKIIALYGALADGVTTPQATITCNGHFLPNRTDAFRCWYYNQYGAVHGPQTATEAIRNSCNIYFYTVGDRLGPARLCEWFARFGLGRSQGTGLIEESGGVVPTEEYLRRAQNRSYTPADVWNFAIGQGEVSATPLQCANVAATVASGQWRPVVFATDSAGEPLRPRDWEPPATGDYDDGILRTIRTGMWRVVNDRGGTADRAKLDHPDHVLCGKTGSAQAVSRPVSRRWFLDWPDGRREEVIAGLSRAALLARYDDPKPTIAGYRTYERFPPIPEGGKLPSHAWFIGFTQSKSTPKGEWPRGKVYAISVIVEYGGSGGRVAGPVAKRIAEYLLTHEEEWGRAESDEFRLARSE